MKNSLIIFFLLFCAASVNAQNNVVPQPTSEFIIYGSTAENYITFIPSNHSNFSLSTLMNYAYVDKKTGVTMYVELPIAGCFDGGVVEQMQDALRKARSSCGGFCRVTIKITQLSTGRRYGSQDIFVPDFEARIVSASWEARQ